ncbi:hypothetical protein HK101_011909, partial [Irineochytrium annulatum]
KALERKFEEEIMGGSTAQKGNGAIGSMSAAAGEKEAQSGRGGGGMVGLLPSPGAAERPPEHPAGDIDPARVAVTERASSVNLSIVRAEAQIKILKAAAHTQSPG